MKILVLKIIGYNLLKGNSKIKLNFIVSKDSETENNKEKTLESLNSFLIEEIAVVTLKQNLTPVICSIHCPHSGDILLKNVQTVEVKSTTTKKSGNPRYPGAFELFEVSAEKANKVGVNLSYGVFGGEDLKKTLKPNEIKANFRIVELKNPAPFVDEGSLNTIESNDLKFFFDKPQEAFDFSITNCGFTNPTVPIILNLNILRLINTKNKYRDYIKFGHQILGQGVPPPGASSGQAGLSSGASGTSRGGPLSGKMPGQIVFPSGTSSGATSFSRGGPSTSKRPSQGPSTSSYGTWRQ